MRTITLTLDAHEASVLYDNIVERYREERAYDEHSSDPVYLALRSIVAKLEEQNVSR